MSAGDLCYHDLVESVRLEHGDEAGRVVAKLCLLCGDQLHPGFGCADCEWSDETLSSLAGPISVLFILRRPCPRHQRVV